MVTSARVAPTVTVADVLAGHLGADASVPVVGETWPAYEHVNVQVALDLWLAQPGRRSTLVGNGPAVGRPRPAWWDAPRG